MTIGGRVRKHRRTKRLVLQLKPGEIALIDHLDLDGPAAEALVECRPAAVLNAQRSMTGEFPNRGPMVLAEAGVPLFDLDAPELFDEIADGRELSIRTPQVIQDGRTLGSCSPVSRAEVEKLTSAAKDRTQKLLLDFAENTLEFIRRQPEIVVSGAPLPELRARLRDRHVVVVARGSGTRGDLRTIRSYIDDIKPVMIGVDGGADILVSEGLRPDIIVGDLDSASDEVLRCGAEIIVHAYADGRAPGMRRARALGIECQTLAMPGTSEDAALALAHEKGADIIVLVGSHTNLPDFLEKGRQGMASTFLTRLKVGDRLVDAKGVRKLYQGGVRLKHLAYVAAAAVLTGGAVIFVSPFMRGVLNIAGMRTVLALRHVWRALFG